MGAVPCDRHQIVAVLRRMRRCELVPPGDFLPAKASYSKNRIRTLTAFVAPLVNPDWVLEVEATAIVD